MVKVSVIIPVYNVEKYLSECLDSICNQTLTDIEIICVNDGSTDNPLNILEDYAKRDDRIVIISKKNNGLGAARNTGLDNVNGEYVYFIDSDDYIEKDTLENCLNACENNNLDFVMFQLINYKDESDEFYQDDYYDMTEVIKSVGSDVFNFNDINDLIFKIPVSAVNKLYNLKFINDLNARFPENILFEDNIFFWKVLLNSKKISVLNHHYYIRRRHSSSITGFASINYLDSMKIHNMIFEIFENHNLFDKFKKNLFNNKINAAYVRFNQVKDDDKPVFFDEMKKDFQIMSEKYDYEEIIHELNPRNKTIFNNIINSLTCKEFMLLMDNYKLELEIKKFKSKNNNLKKKISKIKHENKSNR